MPRALLRTHTFDDIHRAAFDNLYIALTEAASADVGPVPAATMDNAIQAQAPPPSPEIFPMEVPVRYQSCNARRNTKTCT